jgi:tRNA modification GTPase
MIESPHFRGSMRASSNDTIFAAASGFGRAAVSVVRISGPASRRILETLAGGVPEPRRLSLRLLREPGTGDILDQALVAWMPRPGSFTGEDQAELHIHGGIATRAAVLRSLGAIEGCRPAEAGEFTRRAFLNGRMDLSRVEGLADLIDAETEAQRRQAMRQLDGSLGVLVEGWRESLLQALALAEAALDFSDEGDVPEELEAEVVSLASSVREAMRAALAQPGGERLREGFVVVLAGSPNAGKSTLLNALARRDVAIVSPIAGTTRDVIEVRCELKGLPVIFVDTAGLRDSPDPVEQEGVARARARAAGADLVLWLRAPDEPAGSPPEGRHVLTVGTKTDIGTAIAGSNLMVSARTGAGMTALLDRVAEAAQAGLGCGDAILTRERHRSVLTRAEGALGRALELMVSGGALELAAEELRLAARAVGEITGRVDVEDVLDRLFSAFCIGK